MPKIDFFLSDTGSCCIRFIWAYKQVIYRQSNGQCQWLFFFYPIAVCILVRRTHQRLKRRLQTLSSVIVMGATLLWNWYGPVECQKQAGWLGPEKAHALPEIQLVLSELCHSIFSSKECSYLLRDLCCLRPSFFRYISRIMRNPLFRIALRNKCLYQKKRTLWHIKSWKPK